MTDVLVVGELLEGGLRSNTLTAVTLAKQVAEGTGGAFDILCIGEGAKKAAEEAGKPARRIDKTMLPEREVIEEALRQNGGRVATTARKLGVQVSARLRPTCPQSTRSTLPVSPSRLSPMYSP